MNKILILIILIIAIYKINSNDIEKDLSSYESHITQKVEGDTRASIENINDKLEKLDVKLQQNIQKKTKDVEKSLKLLSEKFASLKADENSRAQLIDQLNGKLQNVLNLQDNLMEQIVNLKNDNERLVKTVNNMDGNSGKNQGNDGGIIDEIKNEIGTIYGKIKDLENNFGNDSNIIDKAKKFVIEKYPLVAEHINKYVSTARVYTEKLHGKIHVLVNKALDNKLATKDIDLTEIDLAVLGVVVLISLIIIVKLLAKCCCGKKKTKTGKK